MIKRCKVCNSKVKYMQKVKIITNDTDISYNKLYFCKNCKRIVEEKDLKETRY